MSPQSPPGYDQDYPWAPPAPEVPHSPTTTTTFSTQSSTASSSLDHWLPIVFATNRPTTPFRQTGEVWVFLSSNHPFEAHHSRSTVYGVNLPGSSARLANNYDKILDLYVSPPRAEEWRSITDPSPDLSKTVTYAFDSTTETRTKGLGSIVAFPATGDRNDRHACR